MGYHAGSGWFKDRSNSVDIPLKGRFRHQAINPPLTRFTLVVRCCRGGRLLGSVRKIFSLTGTEELLYLMSVGHDWLLLTVRVMHPNSYPMSRVFLQKTYSIHRLYCAPHICYMCLCNLSVLDKMCDARPIFKRILMSIRQFSLVLECSPMVRETWVQSQVASYQRL